MNPARILLLCAASVLLGAGALADPIVIENVTLLDGRGGAAQPGMTIVIDNHRFVSVAPSTLATQTQGRRFDGRGKFLVPGLMDMHVHLRGAVRVGKNGLQQAAPDRAEGIAALHSYLYAGVTSIYDAGNIPDFIFELRAAERGGKIRAPRIFATGGIVTAPGSHGSGPGATLIESWPQAKAALDEHIARQPDLLKMTLEERGWGARPLVPFLEPGLMRQVIEYYNDHGIRTTVHTSGELRARQAIFAGIDTLAHPVIQGPASDSFAKLMGVKKIPMVTTLTIGENYSRLAEHPEYLEQPLYQAALSMDEIAQLKGERRAEWQASSWTWWMKLMTPVAQENLRQVHAAGGVLVLGTDQSIGAAVHREMELLAAAGIAPGAILRIATLNAAIFLGKSDELGSIETGKLADALLLDADPLLDINNFKAIAMVIKNGEIIDESRLEMAGGAVRRRWGS